MAFKVETQHTVAGSWNELAENLKLIPKTSQYKEMEKAYYAGAAHVMSLNSYIGSPKVSEDAGLAILTTVQAELERYFARLCQKMRHEQN